MTRLMGLTFFGASRSHDHDVHPHEPPATMLVPLMILAVLALVAGFIGTPRADRRMFGATKPLRGRGSTRFSRGPSR